MKISRLVVVVLAVLLMGLYACKSVETTSAMLHNEHGQYEKAIEMASLAIEKDSLDAEAHFQLGYSYSSLDSMGLAYKEFRKAGEIDPKMTERVEKAIVSNWAKHYNRGLAEFQSQNFEGAIKEFEKTTQADPRQVKGWLNLSKVYYSRQKEDSTYREKLYVAVDSLLSNTTKEDEQFSEVYSLAGRVLVLKGEVDRAYKIMDELLMDDPANYEDVENVGIRFLSDDKDYENALRFLKMSNLARMKAESENFESYFNLGVTYYNMERYMQAIEAYNNALMIEPENERGNYSLLLAYYEAEMWDDAIRQGQKYTTEIAPDDAKGWQVLAMCYREKGLKIKAEEAIAKFMELREAGE
jgi:tetratricopeptide (TPR) repeat protein